MVVMDKTRLCMTDVFNTYEKLKAESAEETIPFWDVVVLTTTDAAQQQVYELEIANKKERGDLPPRVTYHVIHDPPGAKIGSGGSTMYTLSKITQLEPSWRKLKILLMHAGGSSQRLPSASVLGKAFTAIPLGEHLYTMFDVKLALCLPFAKRLPPGVFICCPDTFETFSFGNSNDFEIGDNPGFVALAHPSPLEVGTGHGVYILSDMNASLDTELLPCQKVLQKPTTAVMREKGAIITAHHVPESVKQCSSTNEWVFTDSNFFFDHNITCKLVEFYQQNAPLTDEIDAYGDFLQPLGTHADESYINNCKNIMCMSENLISTRRKVFNLLKGTPLSIVTLKQSKFYHIGTLAEYLDSFCEKLDLKDELGLSRFCFSARTGSSTEPTDGCVMHSLISDHSQVDSKSVVEFCKFVSGNVTVQQGCVISNCTYTGDESVTIPSNTFMQTVPVTDEAGDIKYVTLMFSVNDNMKAKACSLSDVGSITYFGRNLLTACHVYKIRRDALFAQDSPITLWHAKLFQPCNTAHDSFCLALNNVKKLLTPYKRTKDTENNYTPDQIIPTAAPDYSHFSNTDLYSFADVIKKKNAKLMIEMRNELASEISAALAS